VPDRQLVGEIGLALENDFTGTTGPSCFSSGGRGRQTAGVDHQSRALDLDPYPRALPPDRQRRRRLLDELAIGDLLAVLAEHPLDDLGLVGVLPAAQRGDDGVGIHRKSAPCAYGRHLGGKPQFSPPPASTTAATSIERPQGLNRGNWLATGCAGQKGRRLGGDMRALCRRDPSRAVSPETGDTL